MNLKDISVFVLGAFAIIGMFYYMSIVQHREGIEWEKKLEKKRMSHYFRIDVNTSLGEDYIVSDTGVVMYLFSPHSGVAEVSRECPVSLNSHLDTQRIPIIFKNGSWYISKASRKNVSKEEVKKHILSCIPRVLEEYENKKRTVQNNLGSWSQNNDKNMSNGNQK